MVMAIRTGTARLLDAVKKMVDKDKCTTPGITASQVTSGTG